MPFGYGWHDNKLLNVIHDIIEISLLVDASVGMFAAFYFQYECGVEYASGVWIISLFVLVMLLFAVTEDPGWHGPRGHEYGEPF